MLFGLKLGEICGSPAAIKRERERDLDCFCSFCSLRRWGRGGGDGTTGGN